MTDDADDWNDGEPAPRVIHSGHWSITLRGDSLSDVRHDGELVLRAIRVVVRDHDWRTIPATVESVDERPTSAGLEVRLSVRNHGLGVDFAWACLLTLADGELRFDVEGRALSGFRRNRIGIVVLHPTEVAGSPLEMRHGSGAADDTSTAFPVEIAPHQPAIDVAGLAWRTAAGEHDLAFRGDVFEMEDQRNWTDASFKTYSTPLSEPFPVQLRPGDVVRQGIVLRTRALAPSGESVAPSAGLAAPSGSSAEPPGDPARWRVRLVNQGRVVPQIVVGASTAPRDDAAPRLGRALPVLVELDTRAANWRAALDRAVEDARGEPLDVRIIASDVQRGPSGDSAPGDPIAGVLDALRGVPLLRIGVFDPATHCSEPGQWKRLRVETAARGIRVPLVGGTRAHFTELNRQHERLLDTGRDTDGGGIAGTDALTFSITPQMHDSGRDQVIASLAVQRLVAEQAVRIAAGRAVHIGPVTLRARFNAVATEPPPPAAEPTVDAGYGPEFVWRATDPRQRSRGFAAWLIASVAALAVPGVESITVGEAWGPRGVESAADEALTWIADIAGWVLLGPVGELAPGVAAIAARRNGMTVVLAANVGAEHRTITIGAADVPDRVITLPPASALRIEV
ncbi:DUF4436 domain-containing protein [Glaciihabitans sp. dw_435]|uniref:DUF4436 domain-containing protein n=1 Tax=Glaciihabitans sp. dw_435 TaxID=2720081 RepID=UPI001BD54E47|nr:DUF4436 domain-containing protein [Glaciihabitans sp. dw_435]